MRSKEEINRDIEALKYEIRLTMVEGGEREVELMSQELDELREELYRVQTT
jgi:hypothetical protein